MPNRAFWLTVGILTLTLTLALLSASSAHGQDVALNEAIGVLDYLEGHLPDGAVMPEGFKREGPRILLCENREFDPRAVSDTGDHGLWQISAYWQRERLANMGLTVADLYEPHVNTVVAIAIFNEQGFRPWACSKGR